MRANDQIVSGDFLGGELEGGTFHHWIPPQDLPATGQETDPASDERPAPARPTASAPDVLTDPDAELEVAQA
jgi:hypothetical protein